MKRRYETPCAYIVEFEISVIMTASYGDDMLEDW